MEEIIFYFIIYAFLGWVVEVSYQTLHRGEFINRGFLNGPYCPIYGFGVLSILEFLTPWQNNLILLFIGAVVLTTLLELFTGYFLWKVFEMRWWDYSEYPFNIGGFITPLFSIAWGLACVFVVKIIHPSIQDLFLKIPENFVVGFNMIIMIFMSVDTIGTVNIVLKLNKNLERVDEMNSKLKDFSNDLGEAIYEGVSKTKSRVNKIEEKRQGIKEDLKLKKQELREQKRVFLEELPKSQKRLLRAFPEAEHYRFNESLKEIKEFLKGK